VVYFEEVVTEYPDTTIAPGALEQLVETYSRLGYVEDAEDARERLLREYPQSPEAQAMQV
jgi:outer membrane protein assembly factor BamD (BamD/ComL family)